MGNSSTKSDYLDEDIQDHEQTEKDTTELTTKTDAEKNVYVLLTDRDLQCYHNDFELLKSKSQEHIKTKIVELMLKYGSEKTYTYKEEHVSEDFWKITLYSKNTNTIFNNVENVETIISVFKLLKFRGENLSDFIDDSDEVELHTDENDNEIEEVEDNNIRESLMDSSDCLYECSPGCRCKPDDEHMEDCDCDNDCECKEE